MKKLVSFIKSAGANVDCDTFRTTVKSILENVNIDIDFYIVTDEESHKIEFSKIFEELNHKNAIINVSSLPWGDDFNLFFDNNKNAYEYILCSHDDISIKTFDFFSLTVNQIKEYEEQIGWIGFHNLTTNHSESAREIFCLDRNKFPWLFELHKMTGEYDESLLDLPKRFCKVPGFYNHFNLIKSNNLDKIGPAANFNKYCLLTDEDWSIRTLIKNMWTVWVPDVKYVHGIWHRKVPGLIDQSIAMNVFIKKWGYDPGSVDQKTIDEICSRYPNTNIGFFKDKQTFEYQYFD